MHKAIPLLIKVTIDIATVKTLPQNYFYIFRKPIIIDKNIDNVKAERLYISTYMVNVRLVAIKLINRMERPNNKMV